MRRLDANIAFNQNELRKPIHCPKTTQLVQSLAYMSKAPVSMILMLTFSSYSQLLQALIDVERPEVGRGSAGLYTLMVAESGERKSTIANLLEKPVMDFLEQLEADYEIDCIEYEAELEVFTRRKRELKRELTKTIKSGQSTEELKTKMRDLLVSEPKKPKKIQLILEDSTAEAIAQVLYEGHGSASLNSSEGASILNGRAMQALAWLNKLWSGESFTVNRKTSESFTVSNARLTISLMTQPNIINKFLKKKGDEAAGIGFLARFLVCNPESTQGQRFIEASVQGENDGYQEYLKFASKILGKVKEQIADPSRDKQVMRFSVEAQQYWIGLFNDIEQNLGINGHFQYARDHGSKLAENIARIAALLSYIELGEDEPISLGILQDAEQIGLYYSDVYMRCLQTYPDYIKDSMALLEYFQICRENGGRFIKKNSILQSGPSRLRNKQALDQAVNNVIGTGEISILTTDTGMLVIDLYPGSYLDQAKWEEFLYNNGLLRRNNYSARNY